MLDQLRKSVRKEGGQGGFTMIEMAVVLVIIGMILSAVMAGKDVVSSSKVKNFVQWVKGWEDAIMQFRTQKGYFPGDGDDNELNAATPVIQYFKDTANGVIGDEISGASNSPTFLVKTFIAGKHEDHFVVEGQEFYIKIGNDNGSGTDDQKRDSTAVATDKGDPDRNVIVVCGSINCDKAISADAVPYLEALDQSIDGTPNAHAGRVRAFTSTTLVDCSTALGTNYDQSTSLAMQLEAGLDNANAAGRFTAAQQKSCIDEVDELKGTKVQTDGFTAGGYDTNPDSAQVGVVYYFDHVAGN
jgi:prepilin-type N-terminal cleavage/methylation domain-containing protein